MTEYLNPEIIIGRFKGNFARLGDVFLINLDNPDMHPREIAQLHELGDAWDRALIEHPDTVDWGEVHFSKNHKLVFVANEQEGDSLPRVEAREETRILLEKLSPGFRVDVHHPLISRSRKQSRLVGTPISKVPYSG